MMRKWRVFALLLSLGAIVFFVGCEPREAQDVLENKEADAFLTKAKDDEETGYPDHSFSKEGNALVVCHDMGVVRVPLHPEKVAVLDLGLLDTMLAVEGDCQYAMPHFEVLPAHLDGMIAERYVGNPKEPDLDALQDFAPDVIFIGARMENHYEQLSKIAPVVYSRIGRTGKDFVEEMHFTTRLMAVLFGTEEKAEAIIQEQDRRIQMLRERNQGKSAFFLVTGERGLLSYDDMSIYAFVYDNFGFDFPMAAEPQASHGKPVALEELVETEVDYVFTFDRTEALGTDSERAEKMRVELIEGFGERTALLVELDAPTWYLCQNGPQGFLRILEEIEDAIC